MKEMKFKLVLAIIFQLLGVTSSFAVSETLDPNFGARYSEALRNEYSGLADQFFNTHLALMLLGYAPFGITGLMFGLPALFTVYPKSLSAKRKQILAVITLFLTVPLLSSFPSYVMWSTGSPIPREQAILFAVTPVALSCLMCGTLGVFILGTLPEHLNSKTEAWLRLIVGFALIIVSWNFLEILLRTSIVN